MTFDRIWPSKLIVLVKILWQLDRENIGDDRMPVDLQVGTSQAEEHNDPISQRMSSGAGSSQSCAYAVSLTRTAWLSLRNRFRMA